MCKKGLPSIQKTVSYPQLLDSLSLSRHGKSSGERVSVMIINPAVGNSLAESNG
jgi:hypothetical protein